ncbi:hypothetical protein Cadr_000013421 [Camelus dromedarius]|uniref:Uncharacterized protein n=1 Tax=Camelus dromedarius TaxID=9838 RepID=A0A5N4DD39_CAMDR|nr:hypothetical protein Cadr_000013421 [Camelus dromedarius]
MRPRLARWVQNFGAMSSVMPRGPEEPPLEVLLLEVYPQSTHLKNGDNNQDVPYPQSSDSRPMISCHEQLHKHMQQ